MIAQGQDESSVLTAELGPTSTVGDLKMFLVGSVDLPSNYPEHSWMIQHNGSPISASDVTALSDAGVKDGDFLLAAAQPANQQLRPSTQPSASSNTRGGGSSAELEQLRQHILNHTTTRQAVQAQADGELTQDGEDLNSVLNDPQRFAERWSAMETRRRGAAEARTRELERLDADVNEENQKEILKRIRQEQIQSDLGQALEQNPEMFGTVTMLYIAIQVNGHPIKAFVDSGAQMTVISPETAERCGISRYIDDRYSGIARGVGTARILGRVHRAMLKISDVETGFEDEVPCSFTVMEGKGVDMLLGLDMLKRYQVSIDLQRNCLVFQNGIRIPFLPESEIPKSEFDPPQSTAGSGASSTQATITPDTSKAPNQQKQADSFGGPGRTLGSAGAPSIASSSASTKAPSIASTTSTLVPPPEPTRRRSTPSEGSSASGPMSGQMQDKVESLMTSCGVSRSTAISVLEQCGGSLEMAAAIIFEM